MNRAFRTTCCASLLAASGLAFAGEGQPWSYSGEAGPEHWSELAPEFAACNRQHQSPIDLGGFIEAELPALGFDYAANGTELWHNGHTVQLEFDPGSTMVLDGFRFALKQLHFHVPAENRIEGREYPLEAHLVHADEAGNLAVVAVLFEHADAPNAALAELWPRLPEAAGGKARLATGFPATRLLPADQAYYRYDGSLTTPPCTEGVRWLVLKRPVPVSADQVQRLSKVLQHPNNRPVQPVNARAVLQ